MRAFAELTHGLEVRDAQPERQQKHWQRHQQGPRRVQQPEPEARILGEPALEAQSFYADVWSLVVCILKCFPVPLILRSARWFLHRLVWSSIRCASGFWLTANLGWPLCTLLKQPCTYTHTRCCLQEYNRASTEVSEDVESGRQQSGDLGSIAEKQQPVGCL